MKTLHSIPREKRRLDWNAIKGSIRNLETSFNGLNNIATTTAINFNTFRDYYVNYPTTSGNVFTIRDNDTITYNLTYTVDFDGIRRPVVPQLRVTDGI